MQLHDCLQNKMFQLVTSLCLLLAAGCHGQNEFKVGTGNDPHNPDFRLAKPIRYLLYDVNPGEGFNLRRDVYIRMANMVKMLRDDGELWALVLPPWGRIYHWKSQDQIRIPWSQFFDIQSLRKHIPVLKMSDWFKVMEKGQIDEMYYLQGYSEGWEDGKWTTRWETRPCISKHGYERDRKDGSYHGYFWGFDNVTASSLKCLSVQAEITDFKKFMRELDPKSRSIALYRAEALIHGSLSEWSKEWWLGRRSMRFSSELTAIGDDFRKTHLNSLDDRDKTIQDPDWAKQKPDLGTALGGPYLAIHLRRRDFLYGHSDVVPSLENAARQIREALEQLKLDTVFLATDAPTEEIEELTSNLDEFTVMRFVATPAQLERFGDGGWTIIDQWICAHARHFIGTSTSTVSFRIHEERSLLGFAPDSTYNRLCGDRETKDDCTSKQPGRWFPKY